MKVEFLNEARWIHFCGKTIEEALTKLTKFLSQDKFKEEFKDSDINIELSFNFKEWRAGCFLFLTDIEEE